mgnify:FL=1
MKDNKAKIYMISSLVVLVIAVIVSGTYAYYVWTTSDSDTTKIVAGIGAATVTFDGGSDISANLRPVSDKSKGIVKNINVKADTEGLVFNMYLDITSIDTGLKDESFRYELYKGTTKVKEGNFSDSYLTSNTVTCTKNNTNHIVLLTNESISTSKTSYTLYIWIDGANYTNPNTMMNKTFNFKLHADGEGAVLAKTAAETITELYMNAEKETIQNNNIDYHISPSVSLMNDRLGGTTEDLDGGNIRYYGTNPNNYMYFNCKTYPDTNCELWRIIGVFDGRLKIMRNESIGKLAFDQDKNDDSSKTTFDNDWSTATLQKLLNGSYYTGSGTIIYYSNNYGMDSTTLNMNNIGLKNDITRNMIAVLPWNLGGWNSMSLYSNQIYVYERGTKVYTGRPTIWSGKIGLIYASDYGYSNDLSKCSQTLVNYSDTTCKGNTWLLYKQSILSLTHDSGSNRGVWDAVYNGSFVGGSLAIDAHYILPTLYLNSDISIESGAGSSSNPYKLSV